MPLFTRETAREASAKANQARWSRWRAEKAASEQAEIPEPKPVIVPQSPADFAARRLSRVREQLDRLDSLMMDETDPKRLKEYADASARLSAQEFDLSGRPKSGSRRPAVEDKRARRGAPSSIFSDGPAMVQAPIAPPSAVQPARPLGWEYDDPSAPVVSPSPIQPVQ